MSKIEIHPPDSFHASLSRENFDIDKFMGKWHVLHSSLPLWKNKKDVTITYTPLGSVDPSSTPSDDPIRFNDIVEYRSASSTSSPPSTRSRIEGIDTLQPPPKDAPDGYRPAASYKWRGKGWLMIASSKWQVLGYGDDWAVTYFSATLFTPAGIDIYSRSEGGVSKKLYENIVSQLTSGGGEMQKLAESLFEVRCGD
ncbi:hypothetical protein DL93DRAFT_371183 [Clavulina sp. PMI_390]|nr:hypothetical protein DL93DRAFT_371183 [Clavulina sp. PMI_390]